MDTSMLETVALGIVLFVTTNLDDIFLTMAFFADPGLDRRAVVVGKFLGIGLLVAASVAAAALAVAVAAASAAAFCAASGLASSSTAARARREVAGSCMEVAPEARAPGHTGEDLNHG
jgi:type IV secretory pathway TrbL component